MFDLYEHIESLCKSKGTSPTKLCVDAKVGRSVLSNLKKGRCESISASSAQKMANVLGVTIDEIFGRKETPTNHAIRSDLMEVLQGMSEEEQEKLLAFLKMRK